MPVQDQRLNFVMQELSRRSDDITSRLRNIEQRLDTLEERFSVTEELDIEKTKKNDDHHKELVARLDGLNDEIIKLKLVADKLSKESAKFARKTELKEIETVLGIIKPGLIKEETEA